MSDSYTIHLLNRHIDGTIFEEECQTLKALLEPCILNLTADELQRKIYSKLVLHCCCTLVDIDDELEQAQHKIANYEDSTDDEDSVNPTKATPVKPSRRVGIPPSPGEVLTPVRRPTGRKQESPRVGVPPSPSE